MKLNLKDFKNYQDNGVIRIKKSFQSLKTNLKRKIDLYIKRDAKTLN